MSKTYIFIFFIIFLIENSIARLLVNKNFTGFNEEDISPHVLGVQVTENKEPSSNKDSDYDNFRYQASLLFRKENEYLCGAVVVAKKVLITAAHCVLNQNANDLAVRVGSITSSKGGQLINISKYIVCPGYKKPYYKNGTVFFYKDISILILQDSIRTEFYFPVTLPSNDVQSNDGPFYESGWGYSENPPLSNLTYTIMKLLPKSECERDFLLCAKPKYPGHGHCQGDSGGPLVYRKKSIERKGNEAVIVNRPILVGIITGRTDDCAKSTTKYIFQNIFSHMKWIIDTNKTEKELYEKERASIRIFKYLWRGLYQYQKMKNFFKNLDAKRY